MRILLILLIAYISLLSSCIETQPTTKPSTQTSVETTTNELDNLAKEAQKNDALIDNQLKLIENIKPLEKVTGLNNCGNTCFMNGALQALFHTPELNRFLQVPLNDITFAKNISKDNSLFKIFQEVFTKYMLPGIDVVSPQSLTAAARKMFFPDSNKYSQEDAQEFLNALFTRFGEELSVAKKLKIVLSDKDKRNFEIVENSYKAGVSEYSVLNRWFQGYYKSVTTKEDGSNLTLFEPFNIVQLKLPADEKKSVDLDEIYKKFSATEVLTDSPGNKDKTISIQKSPQNLVIQLSRFSEWDPVKKESERNSIKIAYPLAYKLPTNEGEINYELYAVVLQSGSLRSGHYTADIKAGNTWYHANDSQINKISEADVLSVAKQAFAYLLFYRKK